MNEGVYDGERIVSGGWITRMTAPHVRLGEDFGNMYYGYLWYRPGKDSPISAAIGDGGNVIYADHKNHISVGVTGTFKPRIFDRLEFIEKKVIPMINHCL